MNVPVALAKAKFSDLAKRVEAGEEVVVTRHGKPILRMLPVDPPKKKKSILGLFKDRTVWMSDDFDAPLEDFKDYM